MEGYGITIHPLADPTQLETSMWVGRGTNNVTVNLQHGRTYTVNLFATSCGEVLRSRNVSQDIVPPQGSYPLQEHREE